MGGEPMKSKKLLKLFLLLIVAGGDCVKDIFAKRGAGLLISTLLLTTSLFGAACTNSGAATGS